MLHHLKPTGRAGIVLANGSMSSSQNNEGQIRAAMVEADVVEVMIALPGQLFFNTQIPACLWFLVKQKTHRQGEVLFIDARKQATMISRVQSELTDAVIDRIAATVAAWRGEPVSLPLPPGEGRGEGSPAPAPYEDIPGFCRSVPLAEIAQHGHVLTPGRYVGAEEVEDNDEDFATRMQQLTEKLGEQMAKGAELDALIRQLGGLGYEFWTRPQRRCFPTGSRNRRWAWCRRGGAWFRLANFSATPLAVIGGSDSAEEKNDTRVAIIRGTDIPDLQSGGASRVPLRYTSAKKLATRKLEDGDIVLEVSGGSKDQPTGRALYLTSGLLSQFDCPVEPASFCRLLRPNTKDIGILLSQHLTFIYAQGKTWEYQNQSTGIANFQTTHFLEKELVAIPPDDLLKAFAEVVRALIERIHLTQIRELATLRDTLLPRLISGQLRLPIDDQQVES
jgi:hypothetical protein